MRYIEKNMENPNFTLKAFPDIEGAFNNVKLIHNAVYAFGIF